MASTNGILGRKMEAKSTMEEQEKEEAQAQVDIWKYVFGFTEMAVVKCAIKLGIADLLEARDGRPMTLLELSSVLNCSPSILYRIMRFLIHRKIFKEEPNGYVQSPLSRLLTKTRENNMAAFILLESSPVMLAPWHAMSARALVTESSAFTAAHGKDLWSYAEANPMHSKLIDDAMACHARVAMMAIVENYGEVFKGIGSLVDVGGGDGTSLGILVKKCPRIQGINFDLPHVVSSAPSWEGVEHVGGNMFEKIPKADAAFVMWVLHDWGDDECIKILSKCREAIPPHMGKVIIAEAVIDDKEGEEDNKFKDVGLALDMVMMAHTDNGKERTYKEWANVLTLAGFSRFAVKHIQAIQSVIEAYP